MISRSDDVPIYIYDEIIPRLDRDCIKEYYGLSRQGGTIAGHAMCMNRRCQLAFTLNSSRRENDRIITAKHAQLSDKEVPPSMVVTTDFCKTTLSSWQEHPFGLVIIALCEQADTPSEFKLPCFTIPGRLIYPNGFPGAEAL